MEQLTLPEWDIEHSPSVRPAIDTMSGPCVMDYVIYKCPVRNCMSVALVDWKGRYWTSAAWHPDGVYLIEYSNGCGYDTFPVAHTPQESWKFDKTVAEMMYRSNTPDNSVKFGRGPEDYHGDASLGVKLDGSPPDEMGYIASRLRTLQMFDEEWGSEAFKRTIRAARARHLSQIRQKQYRRRVKGVEPA